MGIIEKLKNQLDNSEVKSKKSHIKNLFEVALADGRLENIEFDFILIVADSIYLDRKFVQEIYKCLQDIPFIVPIHERAKIDQIFDLVKLAIVDGDLADEELLVCKRIAIQFGFRPVVIDLIIRDILSSIINNAAKDAVLNNIIQQLN